MAEVKLEITDDMINKIVKEQVRARIDKLNINQMIESAINKCACDSWQELKGDELVTKVKLDKVSRIVVDNLSERIVRAFED